MYAALTISYLQGEVLHGELTSTRAIARKKKNNVKLMWDYADTSVKGPKIFLHLDGTNVMMNECTDPDIIGLALSVILLLIL